MAELKKQENLSVAVQVNGDEFISSEHGILFEEVGSDTALLYIKSTLNDGINIKIKIEKKK